MEDGRVCRITFAEQDGKVTVTQVFDPESENTLELQQEGWQAIMDNFRKHMHNLK